MLKKLLTGNVIFSNDVVKWEESIQLAAQALLKKQLITQSYIDKIISSINTKGFYVVISDDVAVPHARDVEGVKQPCLSLLVSSKGIKYGKHDNIRLVFLFGVREDDRHIEMIESLATFLNDKNKLHHLLIAETEEEVLSLF